MPANEEILGQKLKKVHSQCKKWERSKGKGQKIRDPGQLMTVDNPC